MTLDPYAPPQWQDAPEPESTAPLREIVLRWEKLRLLYNAILALPGLGVLAFAVREEMPLWFAVLGAFGMAAGANLCFFLGPLAELYLRALIVRKGSFDRSRRVLFGLGVCLSLLVFAVAALIVYTPPLPPTL